MKLAKPLGLIAGAVLAFQLSTHAIAGELETSATHRYEVKLFELIEKDEPSYDAAFTKSFNNVLAPYVKKSHNFKKRITSGAASNGNLVQVDGRRYIHYGICQAHQCDNTTLNLLFDPLSKRMVAKIFDRCAAEWLGEPDQTERTLLDDQHRKQFPATVKSCGASK